MKELPARNEIPSGKTWDLSPMYASPEAWEKDFKKIPSMLKKVLAFKGRLSESPSVLADAFKAGDRLGLLIETLHVYAHLKADEDVGDSVNSGRLDRINTKDAEIEGELAWFEPELIAMDEARFNEYLKSDELAFYRRTLEDMARERAHVLSEPEERVLGMSSEVFGGAYKTFSVMSDSDIVFPVIKDHDGNDVRVTHGNYIKFLESSDRRVRRDAFKAMYSVYGQFKNTFAAMLDVEVKGHIVESNLRKYPSALEASLSEDNIPRSVYDSLISSVNAGMKPLYDYFAFRAERLGLEKLDMYDIHCPLVPQAEGDIPWSDAVKSVKNALRPLGREYGEVLTRAFNERWIDISECKGKRSGAYSSGCYGYPPYLLLNYSGTLDCVSTLAHELGHSMHSHFSDGANDYHYAGYRIFVAEVASTTNEILLQKYLVSQTADPMRRAYLLNHLIDMIRGTLFRQTMFAEFELAVHETAEKGEPLTADALSDMYFKLNKRYHGPAVTPVDDIRYEWARIPHFHYDFYVYKYATGISAALALANKILSGDTEGYMRFLRAGDSKDVIDIMKDAGVDFTTSAPVDDAMKVFASLVAELKDTL